MKSQISLNRRSAAKHLDKLLDDALEQTFPASDPVAIDFEQFDSSLLVLLCQNSGRLILS
jgi:hypothetical protein